jgi:hypothetical protein
LHGCARSPILAGLLLAAPIARLTAGNGGRLMASLLGTEEERHPHALLASAAPLRAKRRPGETPTGDSRASAAMASAGAPRNRSKVA